MSTTTLGSRRSAQRLEQQRRILLDGLYRLAREKLRKEPQHHLAVLEHVGHARRRAQVVLEHVPAAVLVPHEVDPGDVRIDAVRQIDVLIAAAAELEHAEVAADAFGCSIQNPQQHPGVLA